MRTTLTTNMLINFFFFFQAEDGIRDDLVTGVQTCALPISTSCSGAGWASGAFPLTRTHPDKGRSRPIIIRIVVDLPAPLGPRKPVTTPGFTVKVRSSTASTSP